MFGLNFSGNTAKRRKDVLKPLIDGLETREVYAVSVTFSGSVLTASIAGTDSRQTFRPIVMANTRTLKYYDGSSFNEIRDRSGALVTAGSVNKIVVNGNDMANTIDLRNVTSSSGFNNVLNNTANPRVIINASGGDDVLTGSGFADRIDGGSGNDHIDGRDGDDYLIAGTGRDTIYAGAGDDVIIANAPDTGSIFDGGIHNVVDRYRGKRPGNWTVRNLVFVE